MLSLWPSNLQSSSDMCGAYGERAMVNGSRIERLLVLKAVSSFTQIMNVLTDVLKEKRSISSSIFLMVLCSVFSSPEVGSASETAKLPCSSWNKRQNRFRNFSTPSI